MKYFSEKILRIFLSVFCLLLACLILPQTTVAQTFQQGDLFIAVSNGQVQWRSSTGTLIRTLNTGLGGFTTGMAFDKVGNLYVTNFSANSISKFNTSGVLLGTFGSGYSTPESIVFDKAGNVYVGNLGNGIRKYNSAGTFIGSSFIGKTDWIDLSEDQCTILYTSEGSTIGRHNVCTNTPLPNFISALGVAEAFALRIRQNGDVLLANGGNILRINSAGAVVQTYDVGTENSWFALNLNPDNATFWSANFGTANVYKLDVATGNVLQTINTGTGGNTVFGLAVFGEFTVSVCANNIAPEFVTPSPTCGSVISATVGSPVSFTVKASDNDAGDNITLTSGTLPAGSTMTPTLPVSGNPVSSIFSWTPTVSNTGDNVIQFTATDKCGAKVNCQYTIRVSNATSNNDYYSKSSGELHNVLTWGVNMDGSGANPLDFGAGKTFHLVNRVPNYTMTADWTVDGTIDIPSGSILKINGFTLSEANLIGTGMLMGSPTSSLIVTGSNGGNAGALNFVAGGRSLWNLTLNRTGTGASVNVGTPLDIYNILNIVAGAFNTGGAVTLKSSASNTARVAPVTGVISGNVTVERYIPARRAWRIMSAPVGGSQSINAAWQEGATTSSVNPNPNPGFGTHITQGSAGNGYDFNPVIAMNSILKYNSAANNWMSLSNTNATNVNADAYMLFVRGNRGVTLSYNNVLPNNTILRSYGTLKTGDQTFTVNASGFTSIPNPYASPINFATLTRNHVQNNFYLWDPKLGGVNGVGGYVLLSDNGSGGYNITPTPVSPESQLIQSGQGFLVHSDGTAGSLTIKESDKSATAATNVFKSSNIIKGLRTTLKIMDKGGEASVIDETFTAYGAIYSNNIDAFDPVKLDNMNENLGTVRNGQTLMVERRQPVIGSDTIFLKLWNTEPKQYILQFTPENLNAMAVQDAVLIDNYLKTTTQLSLNEVTTVKINKDGNAASANPLRFIVVLRASKSIIENDITTTKGTFKISPNPITGKTLNVQFINQPKGIYNIELINNLGQVIFNSQVKYAGGTMFMPLHITNAITKTVYQLHINNQATNLKTNIKLMGN